MCLSVYGFVLIKALFAEDINPLELEFQATVCCPLWVLGIERHPLKEKQESILNHWARPDKKRKFLANPVVGNKYRCSPKENFWLIPVSVRAWELFLYLINPESLEVDLLNYHVTQWWQVET